jgi:uncharacterized membrane protein (UPF0127 family)
LKAFNSTRNSFLAEQVSVADSFLSRMRGLLGRPGLPFGDALLITHCNSIHMFCMRFSIDVVFLDKDDRVAGLVERIQPNALSPVYWKACKALELPAGTVFATKTAVNDRIIFQ